MHRSFFSLSFATLFAVGMIGCDAAEPDAPSDRDAVLLLEVDGVVAEAIDVQAPLRAEEALLDMAEQMPEAVCEGAPVDLVLEVEGDEVASVHSCADAPVGGPDSLTAEPDVQGLIWCDLCGAGGNDCFACCKCNGGSTWSCQLQCW